ncbi:hypothetical protein [Calycomorphotria hydatis]|uniref:Uncharacterized protein n=1 Tax=Calycomorphotria hydatis TaxID=2528027 RepID=A0A517TEU4_9PLAN|nr:hypothetical protein [Calycomorphotria hydatis]QDT66885.1 hypothetical protein V22_41570 [Calycomorphotria hydatis]
MSEQKGGKSVVWVVAAAMFLIVAFGWGFLAASYTTAHATNLSEMSAEELEEVGNGTNVASRHRARAHFVSNAIAQLPNFIGVMTWHFTHRIWLPILIVLLEVLVFFGGFGMKALENQLSQPYKPGKKRRSSSDPPTSW